MKDKETTLSEKMVTTNVKFPPMFDLVEAYFYQPKDVREAVRRLKAKLVGKGEPNHITSSQWIGMKIDEIFGDKLI